MSSLLPPAAPGRRPQRRPSHPLAPHALEPLEPRVMLSASFFELLVQTGVPDPAAVYASGGGQWGLHGHDEAAAKSLAPPGAAASVRAGVSPAGSDFDTPTLASTTGIDLTVNRGAFVSPVGPGQAAHLTALVPVDTNRTGPMPDPEMPTTQGYAEITVTIRAPGATSIGWEFYGQGGFFQPFSASGTAQGETAVIQGGGWGPPQTEPHLVRVEVYPVYAHGSPTSAGHQLTVEAVIEYGKHANPPGSVTPTTDLHEATDGVHVVKTDLLFDGLTESAEETTGAFVPRNDDLDEGKLDAADGRPLADREPPHGIIASDNELVDATLELQGSGQGSWKLRVVNAATGTAVEGVKVWRSSGAGGGWVLASDGAAVSGAAPLSVPLKLEGIDTSGGMRDYRLIADFTPQEGQTTPISADHARATVFDVDLVVQGLSEENTLGPHETEPGAMIGLNDDDDDGGVPGVADKDQLGPISGENDLVPLSLSVLPAGLDLGTVKLKVVEGSEKVDLWLTPDKAARSLSPSDLFLPDEFTWALGAEPTPGTQVTPTAGDVPAQVWVEGVALSQALGDVGLTLALGVQGRTGRDDVSASVGKIDLVIAGIDEQAENTEGAFIPLNGDWDEGNLNAQGTQVPDNQPDAQAGHRIVNIGDPGAPTEYDLLDARIDFSGAGKGRWKLEVLDKPQNVKVWLDNGDHTFSPINPTDTFPVTLPGAPQHIKIEGIETSAQLRDLRIKATLLGPDDSAVDDDLARATVVHASLTAYRPRHQGGEGPESYGFFGRRQVDDRFEEDPRLGPGIRINGDDDDGDGSIGTGDDARVLIPDMHDADGIIPEDDLIEVELTVAPAGAPVVLYAPGNRLRLWTSATKAPATRVSFVDGNATPPESPKLWAEWASFEHGTAMLGVQPVTWPVNAPPERLVFHSFQSIVIALGGEGADPNLTFAPGSGIFMMANELYDLGFDIYMYDEDDVEEDGSDKPTGQRPSAEIRGAMDNRGVTEYAMFGHSHGGGAIDDLADALAGLGYDGLVYTAYADAVNREVADDINFLPEGGYPGGSAYHVNMYQPDFDPWHGKQIENAAINFNVQTGEGMGPQVPSWVGPIVHGDMDNNPNIHGIIINGWDRPSEGQGEPRKWASGIDGYFDGNGLYIPGRVTR